MNTDSYISSLEARHARLDRELDEESHRPLPDSMAIQTLKRQKLRIKDEIWRQSACCSYWSNLAAPARSPTRPPNEDDPVGGRVGEWAARRNIELP